MTFPDFRDSASADAVPPEILGPALAALWHDRRGQWALAHTFAQEAGGKAGSWVHAYLHRKEGDKANASYWYHRAGRPVASGDLATEWEQIARALLDDNR